MLATAIATLPGVAELVLVLRGVDEVTQEHADQVVAVCAQAAPGAALPDIVLLGEAEATDLECAVRVTATGEPLADAQAVVLISALAVRSWDQADGRASAQPAGLPRTPAGTVSATAVPQPRSAEPAGAGAQNLRLRDQLIARRDAARAAGPAHVRPVIAVVAQVQSSFGAIDSVCRALHEHPDVDLQVVCVDSEHDRRPHSTADFVAGHGYPTQGPDWLAAQLADPASPLRAVFFYDPWDGLRPSPATAQDVVNAGVRVAYVPYGTNVGAGEKTMQLAYNTPMHQLAWRAFARSPVQRGLYRQFCVAGDQHVRVLGLPKYDRIATLDPAGEGIEVACDGPVVLWNPHFTFGPDGWSTFRSYLDRLLRYAADHQDFTLLIRPHFRLFTDLPASTEGAALLSRMTAAAQRRHNVVLDRGEDYLPAFRTADAMLSDASSLLSEFMALGRPALYLHRIDGPGVTADAQYFFNTDVATSWPAVQGFLDQVRAGRDPFAEHRKNLVHRHFPMLDGSAGARIVDEVLAGLAAEGALTQPAAAR